MERLWEGDWENERSSFVDPTPGSNRFMISALYSIIWKGFFSDFCVAEPDSPPQNLELINVTATEINLRWLPPEQPNGLITHYEVLYSDSNIFLIKNASSTSISLSEMKPYTLYNISVRAFTRLGYGNQSSFPLLVRTSETGEYLKNKNFWQEVALW